MTGIFTVQLSWPPDSLPNRTPSCRQWPCVCWRQETSCTIRLDLSPLQQSSTTVLTVISVYAQVITTSNGIQWQKSCLYSFLLIASPVFDFCDRWRLWGVPLSTVIMHNSDLMVRHQPVYTEQRVALCLLKWFRNDSLWSHMHTLRRTGL